MSSNNSSIVKTLATIAGLVVSCIAIFTFITGYSTLRDMFNSTNNNPNTSNNSPVMQPAQQQEVDTPTTGPFGIRNPSGTIQAGNTIIVDDLALNVEPENAFSTGSDYIRLQFYVENISAQKKLFRFTPNSISLIDDVGNTYDVTFKYNVNCHTSDLSKIRQVSIASGREITFKSAGENDGNWWCSSVSTSQSSLPMYTGPISISAKKLYIVFNGFGPFSGFQVEIIL